VIDLIGGEEAVDAVGREEVPGEVLLVWGSLALACTMSVDVLPGCFSRDEGYVVRCIANHFSVPVMKFFEPFHERSVEEPVTVGDAGCGCEFGTWNVG